MVKEVVFDVNFHGMMKEYMIFLKNLFFFSFFVQLYSLTQYHDPETKKGKEAKCPVWRS